MSAEEQMTYTQLMSHASKTAHDYLLGAVDSVEHVMGKGAAEKYPAIVAALVQASATDYLAAMLSHRIAPALDRIAQSGNDIADKLSD